MNKVTDESIITLTITVDGEEEQITASAGVLNNIALWALRASHFYRTEDCPYFASEAENVRNEIDAQLDKLGFYEGI